MENDNQPETDPRATVTAHYSRNGDMRQRIREALPAVGGDPSVPTYDALHQLDQFHLGGPASTRALADRVGLRNASVLDLGCGIGGPARNLAAEYGCDVTGVDLTETFCRTARDLSAGVGLADLTRFVRASVHDLPFTDAGWDWVWSQHAIMNIPDTARMYAEVARVLRRGGLFVHHDIVAGSRPEPRFPVPWASDPSGSFLQSPDAIRDQMRAAGLTPVDWRDMTETALEKIREARAARAAGVPEPPGPHLVQGPEFMTMRANLARNLEEDRAAVVQGLWRKPASP